MRRVLSGPIVALAVSGQCAWAQPVPAVAQPLPTVVVPNWNGIYVGGHFATGFGSTQYTQVTPPPFGPSSASTKIGDLDTAAGVYVGYNVRLPGSPIVVGVEGDFTWANSKVRLNGPNQDPLQKINRIDTVAGRVGYLVTPTTMVYGKYGASWMEVSGFEGFTPPFGGPFTRTLNATTYGLGIEAMINENVLVRVEANRTKANSDLLLNNALDQYRPEFSQVLAGITLKIDPLTGLLAPTQGSWWPTQSVINRSWTSVFVGGDYGISGGRVRRRETTFGDVGPFTDTSTAHGWFVGADVQFKPFFDGPTFVFGAQYAQSWMNFGFDDLNGVGLGTPPITRFASINRIDAITGRVGVLVTPDTLAYFRAGPAHISFTAEPAFFDAVQPVNSGSGSFNMRSKQIGLGTETFITEHLALRVEGLFTTATETYVLNGTTPGQFMLTPSVMTATVGLLAKF